MIKSLQKRFVTVAMTAVTLLIVLLLGGINVMNIVIVRGEMSRTAQMLADSYSERFIRPDMLGNGAELRLPPQSEHDSVSSAMYFAVSLSSDGKVIHTDISRVNGITEETAEELASQVIEAKRRSGKAGRFRYCIRSSPRDTTIVFLDGGTEIYAYLRVLFLSVGIGVVCWTAMLFLVIILSKRAIRPIAENIEKQKQFITNAGHEIKTPLAIIRSNADAMELYQGESKWSKNIRQQTVRLDGLMKNMLTLARADENGLKANPTEFSLSGEVCGIADSFEDSFALRGISVEREIRQDISVTADREQITQLVSILFDNALKYTDDGGAVSISLIKNQGKTVMKVCNSCENLPESEPERLFERFFRGDKARTQKNGGYGIGLSMARAYAEANGGTLKAEYCGEKEIQFVFMMK